MESIPIFWHANNLYRLGFSEVKKAFLPLQAK